MKKYLNLFLFIGMVIVNTLAVTGVIGNIRTEEVSLIYHSVLTPANMTFSIWSVIYIALFALIIWQMTENASEFREDFTTYFSVSCILNILWIFSWQYKSIALSFASIFFLAAVLLMLMVNISDYGIWARSVVGLYTGWVNIALYANLAALIGLENKIWAVIILTLAVAQIIGVISVSSTFTYSLAAIWGLVGIAVANYSYSKLIFFVTLGYIVIMAVYAFMKCMKNGDSCRIIQ